MANAVVTIKKKDNYGPMMRSIIRTGIDIVDLKDDLSNYDKLIWFESVPPQVKNAAWWMCDLRHPRKFRKQQVKTIFLCNKEWIKDYESHFNCSVHYMPQCGYDAPVEKGRKLDCDVVFIGGLTCEFHQNRADYLAALNKLPLKFKHISAERFTIDQKYIYKTVPISLAISPAYKGYTSNRLYNILSAKGFCLTLYFPGIEDLFENKKHLVWFKNEKEMLELVNYYIVHKAERDKIALNGHKEYLKKHTAKHRLNKMFKLLS